MEEERIVVAPPHQEGTRAPIYRESRFFVFPKKNGANRARYRAVKR
jgi:hypothetical protein